MKLTKEQAKLHRQAAELVALSRELTEDEREFVLDHWQASTNAGQSLDGAFFTPAELARDLTLEIAGTRVIDLCAGIGRLAFHARDHWTRSWEDQAPRELVCVERNPQYVAVGRRVVPEARWICADVLTLDLADLGTFDTAIANPPFGRAARSADAPGYNGPRFEYHVITLAAQIARLGAFIIPQASAPFRLSGEPYYHVERDHECARFERQTGIQLSVGPGLDTSGYADAWVGVAPRVEIAVADFTQCAAPTAPEPLPVATGPSRQLDLFA